MSDESMSRSRELCASSAVTCGADRRAVWTWDAFKALKCYEQNRQLFDKLRGLGYWAWKPELIGFTLQYARSNDVVIYADAGIEFINNVSHIIDRMDQDIFLFGNNWEHAHWCKRDIIDEVWTYDAEHDGPFVRHDVEWSPKQWEEYCQEAALLYPWDRFGRQVQASVIFFRVSDYSKQFVAEWLKWCLFEGGRLIDDSPSRAPNHPEFRENRHDQAILTTMAYREGLWLHAWPAVYNRFLGQEFTYSRDGYPASDDYPSLFHHHRFRNLDFESLKSYRARTLRGFCEDHA